MFAWLILIVLLAAEAGGVSWWLRKEYYPVMFNGWAPLIYSAVLALDFTIAWLLSMLQTPGGTFGTTLLMILGLALMVIVFLFTLFFRWVLRHDMTDIPKR